MLAVLLVSDNSVVSVSALTRELWEDLPPRTALQALRVYISQLRRVLGRLGDGPTLPRLVTQPPGYRLQIEPGSLDIMEFDRLCGKGRQSGSEQRFELAAHHYRRALGLWRGSALSDVRGGPLLDGAALRLEEGWLAALARRIDLDLRLGRHLDLVAELKGLTTEHPLNESLQARLMIALCRSGRTGEALGVYRRVRRSLVEQLDVEPNQELRRVHQAVLSSDDRIFEQVDLWAL
ncbi:BTAD domain-containing putative transcriptional regulator [Actinomadura sp. HBU206391]|uniref:AfsR/SARP family transcriptional regulator n=1 Tax=Actinomadura sp. HBU206391 TaxID=2731692 RepID=UPI001C9BD774|nr:AfsR/SARP family transcriptional regulator [Actinomadura sp. HBU206391]